ncbi:MAG: branched-chain amino acid transport system substrate-binding protein, partial [Thermoleophilaceae bacterium]|nr:branched-chain amino acid transport system substrate-binding protein [Thermoleophilaceae bacterium]
KLGADFVSRLKTVDPKLVDNNYAGEAYDATTIIALAAEQAKSNKGTEIAKKINGITKDGTKCTSFAACKKLIDAGTDPDYDGIIGKLNFTDAGEPGVGSYGVLVFGKDNKIDNSKTTFRVVGEK